MRVSMIAILICGAVGLQGAMSMAQGGAGGAAPVVRQPPAAAQAVAPATAPAGSAPSAIMQPALNNLRGAIDGMHADKWKIPGSLRDETEGNLSSIRKDLDGTLAVLLATADGAPGSVSALMPAYRNIEALYDVVLRVDAAARVGAPVQQAQLLDNALLKLDESRRTFGDHITTVAQGQEKQVGDLQASLKAAQNVPPPPAPVCPAPATTKKPAAKKPAVKKPTTPPPASTQ